MFYNKYRAHWFTGRAGWFIADADLIVGYRKHETLLRRTKRGIPSGAMQYESEASAQRELDTMRALHRWPLFTPNAKPVYLKW